MATSSQTLCSYITSEHTLIATWHDAAPCKEMSDNTRNEITSTVQHCTEQILPAWLICLGPVPYRCGDAVSVPGATSSSASPDIWHRIPSHRLVLTVKFMNGNYQSTFLIPFTIYVSTKNWGGLTIGPHGTAEVGLMSLNLKFDAHSEGSCLLMSHISSSPLLPSPGCAG